MNSPHLDDEQLSAHLDGEVGKGAAEHLGSCRECEGRLARLLLVSSLVGSGVPAPPEGARDAAVQAARAEWSSVRHNNGNGGKGGVVALAERRRLPRWALPVAAAAAALLVAVPVIATFENGRENNETAATLDDQSSAGGADTASSGIDGGDLGEQSDPAALARAIRGALPGAASEAALAAPAPPPAGAEADASATSAAPAPDRAAPTAGEKTRRLGERPCTGVVRDSYGQGLGPLVYTALVRWEGTPAVVLAYRLAEAGAPGLDYRVLVMARQDCRLLVGQSL